MRDRIVTSRRWPELLAVPVLLALWSLAVFLPALSNDFVHWDDDKNFLENTHYRGLGWTNLRWMFTSSVVLGHYIPLSWITLGLDYVIWGMNPGGYHLTNILLHAANTVLVYFLARRLLELAIATPIQLRGGRGAVVGGACAALLFAIHPLRVESVAWITERRDVLSGALYLLAILTYLRHAESAARGDDRRRPWYWTTLGIFVLALLAKSMSVTLPAVLLILDVYPLRRTSRSVWMEKIPFVVLSAVIGVITVLAGLHTGAVTRISIVERVVISLYSPAFYLWKTVVPVGLAPLYEMPAPIDPKAWPFLLSGVAVVSITAAVVAVRRRWPALSAVWAAYIVILLPVIGIVQNGPQIAADRYTYLACIGWAILVGGILASRWQAGTPRVAFAALGLALSTVTVLSILTWNQVKVWRDSETLWTYAVVTAPSAIGHFQVGLIRTDQNRIPEAADHLHTALRISPRFAKAHSALGIALVREGKHTEAVEHFRESVTLTPTLETHFNLGLALLRLGRRTEAAEHFASALKIEPGFAPAHRNLGLLLVTQDKITEAIEHFEQAVRIDPQYADAHVNLGSALIALGRADEGNAHIALAQKLRAMTAR